MNYNYILKSPEHMERTAAGEQIKAGERALFKYKGLDRYYRSDYIPFVKGHTLDRSLKLHVMHSMKEALEMRERLHEYCGEWFDVYRNGEKMT